MSPFLAVSVLHVFSKGKVLLDEEKFDEAVDALISLLEDANNNKHKLITQKGEKE